MTAECEYSFDPVEHEQQQHMPRSEDCVWSCPRPAVEGADHCKFHLGQETRDELDIKSEKIEQQFQEAVHNAEESESTRFIGCTFENIDISDITIDMAANETIDLSHATIHGNFDASAADIHQPIRMEETEIKGNIDWSDATLTSSVHCAGLTVGGRASFRCADFRGVADFSQMHLRDELVCRETEWLDDCLFRDAIFESRADFASATFDDDADFYRLSARDVVVFKNVEWESNCCFQAATFQHSVDFYSNWFHEGVNFRLVSVGGTAQYTGSRFEGNVLFLNATFEEDALFKKVDFDSHAYFQAAQFWGSETSFSGATFRGKSKFQFSIFSGEVSISYADFHNTVSFHEAEFQNDDEKCSFFESEFRKVADFRGTAFHGNAQFEGTTFHAEAYFGRAQFCHEAKFENTEIGAAYFDRVQFQEGGEFSKAQFNISDFRDAVFQEDAEFENGVFRAATEFRDAVFQGYAQFKNGEFRADADFSDAVFQSDAQFKNGVFCAATDFRDAVFQGYAQFENDEFRAKAEFDRARFDGHAGFQNTSFEATARFRETLFSCPPMFPRAELATMQFINIRTSRDESKDKGDPKKITLNIKGGSVQEGEITQENDVKTYYNFQSATIGDIDIEFNSTDRPFNHLFICYTEFDGFDFSQYRYNLAPEWKLHMFDGKLDYASGTLGDRDDTDNTDATEGSDDSPADEETDDKGESNTESTDEQEVESDDTTDDKETNNTDGADIGHTVNNGSKLEKAEHLETTYLKAKNGANNTGDSRTASKFFVKELYYRRYAHLKRALEPSEDDDNIRTRTNSLALGGMNWLLSASCGYGEKPYRPLAFAGSLVLVYTPLYILSLDNPPYIQGNESGLIDSALFLLQYLLFSFQSFLAVIIGTDTTGFGVAVSLLSTSQAFAGAFLIGLFVFTLTRSIHR